MEGQKYYVRARLAMIAAAVLGFWASCSSTPFPASHALATLAWTA